LLFIKITVAIVFVA